MRVRAALTCAVSILLLAGCAGGAEGEESVDFDQTPPGTAETTQQPDAGSVDPGPDPEPGENGAAPGADEGASVDDVLGNTELPLAVGDCFGLEDEIQLDPIPCSGPHIYEVVGIVLDWPHEDYKGSFEARVAGDEAMMRACEAEATSYFGYDPVDVGIMVDHDRPQFWGHEDKVVCSAHSGPDVETVRDEVVGSFEDRGW